MVGSLEVVRSGRGWDPLMGRRLGPSADEQRASVCARARARCQWRQLANYTGRLHPIADVGHPQMDVGEALNVCYEDCKKEGAEIVFECVISGEAECDREKHSVFYMAIIAHPTSLSRQERDFPTTTR